MLERLARPGAKDVVDIGCGGGALVRELTARGARVVGVEVSAQQLAAAVAQDDGNGARYVIGEAQRLPLDESLIVGHTCLQAVVEIVCFPTAPLDQAFEACKRVDVRVG